MSEENVESVRSFYQADPPSERAMRAFFETLDEEIEFDASASRSLPEYRTLIRGKDAVIDYYRHWWGTWWEDVVIEPIEIRRVDDDRVLGTDRQRGRGRRSGAPFEIQITYITTFRAGKVVRMQFFDSRAEALEAAGLEE